MEKKKLRFNVIDIFIIIIAILLVTAFTYYATGRLSSGGSEATIRYTVAVENISEEFINLVNIGDNVRNVDRACEAGTVVAVSEATPHISYNENTEEGAFVAAEVPDKYRFEVVVESPYTNTGLGYYIDQVEIRTGKKISLKTPGFAFSGVIMNIERSDA